VGVSLEGMLVVSLVDLLSIEFKPFKPRGTASWL
jgi:hypothetical protein